MRERSVGRIIQPQQINSRVEFCLLGEQIMTQSMTTHHIGKEWGTPPRTHRLFELLALILGETLCNNYCVGEGELEVYSSWLLLEFGFYGE